VNKKIDELLNQGMFDRSATLEAIKMKKSVSMTQYLANGRQVLWIVVCSPNSEG
jgi:hypothetical protein